MASCWETQPGFNGSQRYNQPQAQSILIDNTDEGAEQIKQKWDKRKRRKRRKRFFDLNKDRFPLPHG